MVLRKRLKLKGSAIVFVTTTVFKWKPIFLDPRVMTIILDEINKLQKIYEIAIICYVIMPHHIHMILGFPEVERLSKIIQSFKSITSRRVKELNLPELRENNFRLWMPRFDDLILYSEEQLKIKIEYIHNNPVKAGLVASAKEWCFSSASDWLKGESGVVKIDKDYDWLLRG